MAITRKKLMFGFVTATTVLLLASTAYACTVWVGKFTVTTDRNGDADRNDEYEKVTTYGLGTGMNHCWMEGAIKVHVGLPHTPSTVNIDYRAIGPNPPVACADAAADLRAPKDGAYTVSYLNTGFGEYEGGNTGVWEYDRTAQRVYKADCMAVGGHRSTWRDSTDFTVSGGAGNSTRQITPKPASINGGQEIPDLPGTESAMCIQQKAGTYSGAPDGAQAPIIVI